MPLSPAAPAPLGQRLLSVGAGIAVLALAALLRFWALGRPDSLVFDELYYVRDAVSQLAHGVPTTWPDDDPALGGERSSLFSGEPSTVSHPPLGKWLIGLGLLLFGTDSGWGWRTAVAFTGVATVGLTMLLGWRVSRSWWIGVLAGFLLAIDGVHLVLTRVALLDGFLTFFVALGALFVWHDIRSGGGNAAEPRLRWKRPWLLCAGLAFGAAAGVKWSGLYPLACFLVLIVVVDLVRRFVRGQRRPVLGGALQALVTAAIALPAAVLAYLASWTGWVIAAGTRAQETGVSWWSELWQWHADMLSWHASLSAVHPYQANPLGWPLGLRPTAMYKVSWPQGADCPWVSGCAAGISPIPNLLVTWGGVAALVLLGWFVVCGAWIALRPGGTGFGAVSPPAMLASAFVLTGFLSGWLPWVATFTRPAVFQFYAVVLTPFAALALAMLLGELVRGSRVRPMPLPKLSIVALSPAPHAVQGRRIAVAVFLVIALVLSIVFFPVWAGSPVAEWFWRAHMWLPGWN